MNRLSLQLSTFLIYLINHICNLSFTVEPLTATKKFTFVGFICFILIIFLYDYFFNYRKKGAFKASFVLYLGFSIGMWLVDGFYLISAANAVLLVVAIWMERRLQLKEELEG